MFDGEQDRRTQGASVARGLKRSRAFHACTVVQREGGGSHQPPERVQIDSRRRLTVPSCSLFPLSAIAPLTRLTESLRHAFSRSTCEWRFVVLCSRGGESDSSGIQRSSSSSSLLVER